MAKIIVDGNEIDVPAEYTLLQAAEAAGKEIPRFCYHERLSIAGNCRMCLVEVKGGPPKPAASCAMAVKDMRPGPNGEPPEIMTNTPMVKKAREGVMEFLLINHPLDCPICDQGGECDLQDQAVAFGMDATRYRENKRAVEDKYIGPLVKTIMNRCIHCTRCVRFTTEVAGVAELGLVGRGEDAEITTYLEHAMSSELQGNVIDLCPVGALTSKPYAYQARPWELSKTESVDVMDAVGSAIRVDTRGRKVMRIMPRTNEPVNEEWISDKTRFVWDGLDAQRLDRPYVRENGRLRPASWGEAFATIAREMGAPEEVGAIAGDLSSVEDMYATKRLLAALNSLNMDCRPQGSALDPSLGRSSYLFNTSFEGVEDADYVLFVGANPRKEAAVLNARFRRIYRHRGARFALVGERPDLTYGYEYHGAGPASLNDALAAIPADAEHPMIVVGEGAINRTDGAAILRTLAAAALERGVVRDGWNGFNVLHNAASRVGGLDIGFVPGAGTGEGGLSTEDMLRDVRTMFFLEADELDMRQRPHGAFNIYVGTHGDVGAHHAHVILPSATYTEKSGTYVNAEGRVQLGQRAAFPPGEAKETWAIMRALSDVLGRRLPFDSLDAMRRQMHAEHEHLDMVGLLEEADSAGVEALAARTGGEPSDAPFRSAVDDFYLTNPIARASKVMAECSQMLGGEFREAAE